MSSLISGSSASELTGVLGDHFDTFQRTIVVHKEPIKRVVQVNSSSSYAGYGETSNQTNFTYTPQNSSFPAIVIYGLKQTEIFSQVGSFPAGTIKIKVKEDAANYINEGKTEKIEVDGKSFNAVTADKMQNYLGLKFYIYYLERTS
jgi:hypothetical protein